MIQIKHIDGEVALIKTTPTDVGYLESKIILTEEEAIQLLGINSDVVRDCRRFNANSKRDKINKLEIELKQLKESL